LGGGCPGGKAFPLPSPERVKAALFVLDFETAPRPFSSRWRGSASRCSTGTRVEPLFLPPKDTAPAEFSATRRPSFFFLAGASPAFDEEVFFLERDEKRSPFPLLASLSGLAFKEISFSALSASRRGSAISGFLLSDSSCFSCLVFKHTSFPRGVGRAGRLARAFSAYSRRRHFSAGWRLLHDPPFSPPAPQVLSAESSPALAPSEREASHFFLFHFFYLHTPPFTPTRSAFSRCRFLDFFSYTWAPPECFWASSRPLNCSPAYASGLFPAEYFFSGAAVRRRLTPFFPVASFPRRGRWTILFPSCGPFFAQQESRRPPWFRLEPVSQEQPASPPAEKAFP